MLSRDDDNFEKVPLEELAPDAETYLGLVAYLQLEVFEASSIAVANSPDISSKEALTRMAKLTLDKHEAFVAEIRRKKRAPERLMEPFTPTIDAYIARISSDDWHEQVLSVYLISGLFDAFFSELADGMPGNLAKYAKDVLADDTGRAQVATLLQQEIAANDGLADRLALWGRRLVGDSLLVCRAALVSTPNDRSDDGAIEPVLSELIATHIRRMDDLGLTA